MLTKPCHQQTTMEQKIEALENILLHATESSEEIEHSEGEEDDYYPPSHLSELDVPANGHIAKNFDIGACLAALTEEVDDENESERR